MTKLFVLSGQGPQGCTLAIRNSHILYHAEPLSIWLHMFNILDISFLQVVTQMQLRNVDTLIEAVRIRIGAFLQQHRKYQA